MVNQSYKSYLREAIRKLEATKKQRVLTAQEATALEELYYKLDTHQSYLNESGQAYENY